MAIRLLVLLIFCLCGVIQAQPANDDEVIEIIIGNSQSEVLQEMDFRRETLRAIVTFYPCTNLGNGSEASYERLDIIDLETGVTHFVMGQINYCSGPEAGIGPYGLEIVKPSNSGDFLYFTDERDGSPGGFPAGWKPTLHRVNAQTMQVETLGLAEISSISTWVVMWDSTQISVIPMDGQLSDRRDFPLQPENLQVLSVTWLPDESGIIYVQANDLFPPNAVRNTVTHIDLETQTQTVLLQKDN